MCIRGYPRLTVIENCLLSLYTNSTPLVGRLFYLDFKVNDLGLFVSIYLIANLEVDKCCGVGEDS